MPCLVGCIALAMPRFAIVLVVIFSDYIGRGYPHWIWPLLGFFFLPTTTLAYAWAQNSSGGSPGALHLLVVVVAVLLDLGLLGTGESSRRKMVVVRAERRG
jgi:hypothetical protein